MSGSAVFSGTSYQASVIAYVYVHILASAKLRWLEDGDDTPTAISGETKGPGDDARVELRGDVSPFEVQVKHGLKRDQRLTEVFEKVSNAEDTTAEVVLTVDSSSSRRITFDLRRQLRRTRAGRTDDIQEPARSLLNALGADGAKVLSRVQIVVLDLDSEPFGRDTKRGVELLADNLRDPESADSAWKVLVADGALLCADRLRRNKGDLVTLLKSHGIEVRPPRATRRWHADLRLSKRQLDSEEPEAALSVIEEVETETAAGQPDGALLYKLNQHKAAACLQLRRLEDAKTFARKALDHEPKGLHALANLAQADLLGGDLSEADELANRMLVLHPDAPVAWLIRAHVSSLTGQPIPKVPASVAETPEFRRGWTSLCLVCGRLTEAQECSARLIAEGDRSPRALLLRAGALLAEIDQLPAEPRLQRADEVDRLCSEVVDESKDATRAQFGQALRFRSHGRKVLGNASEARDDIERAFLLRPNDQEILRATALSRCGEQDALGALTVLSHPIVSSDPLLLAMRAGVRVETKDTEGAQRDIDAALALPWPDGDSVRSVLFETALVLGDLSLATRLLSELSEDAKDTAPGQLMQAHLAVAEKDLRRAAPHYRAAAVAYPGRSDDILAELGVELVRAGSFGDAVAVLGEVRSLPDVACRAFVHALVALNRLSEAQTQLNALIGSEEAPDWALDYAARIAFQADDVVAAARHLEELIGRGQSNHSAKLALAHTLLELDLQERATVYIDELRRVEDLSPRDQMGLAQLLVRLEESDDATDLAYRAYRRAHRSAEMNRAFVGVVMNSRSVPRKVERVGPGTHVRLVDDEGSTRDYVVLQETDDEPLLEHELTQSDAKSAGIMGRQRDEALVGEAGAWMQEAWRVSEIDTAVRFTYNDVLSRYATRFPAEDFFVKGFTISSGNLTPTDLAPFVSVGHNRERHIGQLAHLYKEHVLPLEMVAKGASIPVVEFMLGLQESEDMPPLFVEFSDRDAEARAQSAAHDANRVVLTRTALLSLWQLDLQDSAASAFRLLAPRALRTQVREELADAEKAVRDGRTTLGRAESGLPPHELPTQHPALVLRRDNLRSQLKWLDERVEVRPRPLEAFGGSDGSDEHVRAHVGSASHDAVELVRAEGATLYADDLGLRVAVATESVPSFSSAALVRELSERGAISAADRNRLLVDLVERHYVTVRVTAEMLVESLRETRKQSSAGVVFVALAVSVGSAEEGATIVMQAVKQVALKRIATRSTPEVTRRGLEALASRFSRLDAVTAIERAAVDELTLLPRELHVVHALCQEMRQSGVRP